MGLAGGWPDVTGATRFILLALQVGHNAHSLQLDRTRMEHSAGC